jgi:hypothetical protein
MRDVEQVGFDKNCGQHEMDDRFPMRYKLRDSGRIRTWMRALT